MKIIIDTTPYVRSHCREPRGYGSWAFAFGRESGEPWFAHAATLAEARKAAKAEAARRGALIVFVLP